MQSPAAIGSSSLHRWRIGPAGFRSPANPATGADRHSLFCRPQPGLLSFFRSPFVRTAQPGGERRATFPSVSSCCFPASSSPTTMPTAPNGERSLPAASGPPVFPASIRCMPSAWCSLWACWRRRCTRTPGLTSAWGWFSPRYCCRDGTRRHDLLEHACLDHVHRGVLLSIVPVADHAPPPTPDSHHVVILFAVWLSGLVLPRALHALQPGRGSPSRPLFCRDMDAGAEIHAAAASAVLPLRHGAGIFKREDPA